MAIELASSERETHINQVADDRSKWDIFSEDTVFVARLQRLGYTPYRTTPTGAWFTLPSNALTIRKPGGRQLTEQQRAELAARLRRPDPG